MRTRCDELRARIRAAVVSLCKEDAFYMKELRIEGTLCIVSDRTSVLVTQITEIVGDVLKQKDEEMLPNEKSNPLTLVDASDVPEKQADDKLIAEEASVDCTYRTKDGEQEEFTTAVDQDHQSEAKTAQYSLLVDMTDGDDLTPASQMQATVSASLPANPMPADTMPTPENLVPDVIRINGRYKCPFCDKSYHLKRSAKAHLASHLYVKHYRCKSCPAKFASAASLTTHERRHHSTAPAPGIPGTAMQTVFTLLQCDLCGERCMDSASLKDHHLKCHKEKSLPVMAENTTMTKQVNEGSEGPQQIQLIPQNAAAQLLIQTSSSHLIPHSIPSQMIAAENSIIQHCVIPTTQSLITSATAADNMELSHKIPAVDDGDADMTNALNTACQEDLNMTALLDKKEDSIATVGSTAALDVVMKSIFPDHICEEDLKNDSLLHGDSDTSALHDAIFSEDTSKPSESESLVGGDYSSPETPLVAEDDTLVPLFSTADITGSYVNNFQSPESSSLHYEDAYSPSLVTSSPSPEPSAGLLTTSCASGISVTCSSFMSESSTVSIPLSALSSKNKSDLSLSDTAISCSMSLAPPTPTVQALPSSLTSQPQHSTNSAIRPLLTEFFEEVNIQTERGTYKYRCRSCSNMFKVRNTLYEHMNSHLGRKPFTCKQCGQCFAHHSSLYNHMRNKHTYANRAEKEAQFKHKCLTCPKRFEFPSSLDRHYSKCPSHAIKVEGKDGDLEI